MLNFPYNAHFRRLSSTVDCRLLCPFNFDKLRLKFSTPKASLTTTLSIENRRSSAVIVPLLNLNFKPSILFTVRSKSLSYHRNEVSFPGGAIEGVDKGSAIAAALRETEEEIGIPTSSVTVLGHLAPVISDKAHIVPIVGILCDTISLKDLKLDPREVAGVFAVPLEHFFHQENQAYTQFKQAKFSLPIFFYENRRIWGITGSILHLFLRKLFEKDYNHMMKFIKAL